MLVERKLFARKSRKVTLLCQKISSKLIFTLAAAFLLTTNQPVHATTAGTIPGQISVSPAGVALYSIPITTPPGVGGVEPRLGLIYSSQLGNGLLGMGWSLSGLSVVTRCPKTALQDGVIEAIQNNTTDNYCVDGQRLVAIAGTYGADSTEYRTEQESYSRIISYGNGAKGPVWFKVWTKAGQVLEYGHTADSAIQILAGTATQVWALNKVSDIKGNYLTVTYDVDSANGQSRPLHINYTGNDKATQKLTPNKFVRFEYEARPDITPLYAQGAMSKTTVRLSKIRTYVGSSMIKDYQLAYEPTPSPSTGRTRLASITECGSVNCLQPTKLVWQSETNGFTSPAGWITGMFGADTGGGGWGSDSINPRMLADVNGDGLSDIVGFASTSVVVALGTGTGFSTPTTWLANAYGNGVGWGTQDQNPRMVVDLNGDGKADILGHSCCGTVVSYSTGTGFTAPVNFTPGMFGNGDEGGGWGSDSINPRMLADVNGDGLPDIVGIASTSVVVALRTGTGYSTPTTWLTNAYGNGVGWGTQDQNPRMVVDLNGDGKADILGFSCCGTVVSYSTGTGFTAPVTFTSGWFGNGVGWGSINPRLLADVNGDGYLDIVGIGSTSVVVALGTGTGFNTPTTWLTNAYGNGVGWGTQDQNPRMVVDLNGDGKADILGFSCCGTVVSYSTGTGFTAPVNFTPGMFGNASEGGSWGSDGVTPRKLADLNGDGLPDIVGFSSVGVTVSKATGPYPDLLTKFTNGLDAVTDVTYKPLTDSTVYTKGTGSVYPILDIQVPAYVVSNVSSSNGVGGNFVSSYSYAGAKSHLAGGGYLGFQQTTSVDALSGIKSTSTYSQNYPYQGLLLNAERRTASGMLLNQTVNTWGFYTNPAYTATPGGAQYHFALLKQSNGSSWELASDGAAQGAMVTQTTACNVNPQTGQPAYDAYGNSTYSSEWSTNVANCATPPAKTGLFVKESTNTYSNDTVNWFLGRLTSAAVTNTVPYVIPAAPTRVSQPTLTIAATMANQVEGNTSTTAFTFTVVRGGNTAGTTSVSWSVAGSSAKPADATDFVGGILPSGTVSFSAGQTSQILTVNVQGDATYELDEGFTVTLGSPVNATLGTNTATGTILNDDPVLPPPVLSIGAQSADIPEGNSASTAYTFTVTRSGDTLVSPSVNWAVTGTGATPANAADFAGGVMHSGTLVFASGQTSQTISINVLGDTILETDEGFSITLNAPVGATLGTSSAVGTIRNDDSVISITALAADRAEGDSGATPFTFTVARSGAVTVVSTVNWAVVGNGANAADFVGGVLPSGTLTFAAGQTSQTLTVNVQGDTVVEANEGFSVTLGNPSNATLGTASAAGVIRNESTDAYYFTKTISSQTFNYNLRADAIAAGWNQTAMLNATVTVNSGAVIGSNSTATPAFAIDGTYPAGSSIYLDIKTGAYVVGKGGSGGKGGGLTAPAPYTYTAPANVALEAGGNGGPAMFIASATGASITIANNGVIGGGGGGGGGGAWVNNGGSVWNGGGGGGGGAGNGAGGAAPGAYWLGLGVYPGNSAYGRYYGYTCGYPGSTGAATTAGAGGARNLLATSVGLRTGAGGNGGGLGASGAAGGASDGNPSGVPSYGYGGGTGGAAGAAVIGNGNVSWSVVGTRLGALQ